MSDTTLLYKICTHIRLQIKLILEAISILLSSPTSPFVCLIAIDTRVAVKSIENEMGGSLLKGNITGHEYMRKIINLPFCLPIVSHLLFDIHSVIRIFLLQAVTSFQKNKTL